MREKNTCFSPKERYSTKQTNKKRCRKLYTPLRLEGRGEGFRCCLYTCGSYVVREGWDLNLIEGSPDVVTDDTVRKSSTVLSLLCYHLRHKKVLRQPRDLSLGRESSYPNLSGKSFHPILVRPSVQISKLPSPFPPICCHFTFTFLSSSL